MEFLCSGAQFHFCLFHLLDKQKAIRSHTQKLLLRKLLSSFNLRELYLFIICSQAVLLWQGTVKRGNLSLPTPPLSPTSPARRLLCFLLCFRVVPLRREKHTELLRCILCSLFGINQNETCLNQYFF